MHYLLYSFIRCCGYYLNVMFIQGSFYTPCGYQPTYVMGATARPGSTQPLCHWIYTLLFYQQSTTMWGLIVAGSSKHSFFSFLVLCTPPSRECLVIWFELLFTDAFRIWNVRWAIISQSVHINSKGYVTDAKRIVKWLQKTVILKVGIAVKNREL